MRWLVSSASLACVAVLGGVASAPSMAHALQTAGMGTGTESTSQSPTSPGAVNVVALGDSVPAGTACDCRPFPVQVGATIGARQGRPYATTTYARADDSAATRQRLSDPTVRHRVARSDLVVVQVGANDFDPGIVASCRNRVDACYGADLRAMRRNVDAIVKTTSTLQRSAGAEVVVVGYWNVFADGAVGRRNGSGYVIGSERLTARVNSELKGSAARNGALFVDGMAALRGRDHRQDPTALLAADGDHPNAAGHRALARAVIARLGSRVSTV